MSILTIGNFCKSLEAGTGTDAANFEGGRVLQKEDIEDETEKLLEINDGEMDPEDSIEKTKKGEGHFFTEKEIRDLAKAQKEKEITDIENCISEIEKGNLTNADEGIAFLIGRGFEKSQARETMLEIIEQGGRKMAKGNFSETVDEILKSIGVKKSADEKKKPEDEEIEKEKGVVLEEIAMCDDSRWACFVWCAKEAMYKLYGRRGVELRGELRVENFDSESMIIYGGMVDMAQAMVKISLYDDDIVVAVATYR